MYTELSISCVCKSWTPMSPGPNARTRMEPKSLKLAVDSSLIPSLAFCWEVMSTLNFYHFSTFPPVVSYACSFPFPPTYVRDKTFYLVLLIFSFVKSCICG